MALKRGARRARWTHGAGLAAFAATLLSCEPSRSREQDAPLSSSAARPSPAPAPSAPVLSDVELRLTTPASSFASGAEIELTETLVNLGVDNLRTIESNANAECVHFREFKLRASREGDDARAYGERGYARILAKDYKAGLADLDKASSHTADQKLLAEIWFNDGLAAEGLGDAEKARAAFARSNALNPTKAAGDRLAGKAPCAATFDEKGEGREEKTFADWKAAYDVVQADESLSPWSGDASLAALCGDGWKNGDPCLRMTGDATSAFEYLYVQTASGKVVLRELDMATSRCGASVDATLVGRSDGIVHVRVHTEEGNSVWVGPNDAGEIVDCEDGMQCAGACGEPIPRFHDVFVDQATGRLLLDVVREAKDGGKDPLAVTRSARSVEVKGPGCDRKLTLGSK